MRAAVVALSLAALSMPTAALVATGQPAHAEDHRPCVSTREFRGMNMDIPLRELEADWDVRGERVPGPNGAPEFQFRHCGYSLDEAAVWVVVEQHHNSERAPRVPLRSLEVRVAIRFVAFGATLHGRP